MKYLKQMNNNRGISKILLIGGGAVTLLLISAVVIVVILLNQENESACSPEGTRISAFTGSAEQCCEGLTGIEVAEINEEGECSTYTDMILCSNCGNGTCESHENECNCPEDCPDETAQDLTIEEYDIVSEDVDTPDHFEFKDYLTPDILSVREDWRIPPIISSNVSTSETVDPFIDQANLALEPYNHRFRQNIAPAAPIDSRAFYDLYFYNNKVFTDLSFIRKFHTYENTDTFSFAADQVSADGKSRSVTYFDGELMIWDEDHVVDSIIYDGKLLEIVEETPEGGPTQYVVKNEEGTIYTLIPEEEVFTDRIVQNFFAWNNHWILEYRNTSEQNIVMSDGISVAKDKKYDQVFNYKLINDSPFFFFERAGQYFISYDGQEYEEAYDLIVHNNCCEPSVFNPTSNEDMIWFYALKDGTWYYVEAGIYE